MGFFEVEKGEQCAFWQGRMAQLAGVCCEDE